MLSQQAAEGSSPLDSMIQRLQQEQDQRLGSDSRATRGQSPDNDEHDLCVKYINMLSDADDVPCICVQGL